MQERGVAANNQSAETTFRLLIPRYIFQFLKVRSNDLVVKGSSVHMNENKREKLVLNQLVEVLILHNVAVTIKCTEVQLLRSQTCEATLFVRCSVGFLKHEIRR